MPDPCAAKGGWGGGSASTGGVGLKPVRSACLATGHFHTGFRVPTSRVLLEANVRRSFPEQSPYRPSGNPLLAEYKFSLSPFERHPT